MGAPKAADWRKLPLSLTELCIDTTLRCGQSFRWRKISDEWHCVLRGRIISLKQDPSHLHYRATWPQAASSLPTPTISPSPLKTEADDSEENDDTASLLHNYFALSHSLTALYDQWTASDANFACRAPAFTGIRILNQEPWEALIAFICSSNNNISRITQMVLKLCLHYGPCIGTIEGEPFHDFPGPEALSGRQVEGHLRELGFGYRAKYIAETARIVSTERPAGWLPQLRNPASPALGQDTPAIKPEDPEPAPPATYRAAHSSLLELTGVGPKVADCVCLMGLGWGEAVPVDTHVWQIAQRDYKFGKGAGGGGKSKTFTKTMYDAIGDHFRAIWGPQAGWAQSVLFTANLKSFSEQAQGNGVAKAEGAVKKEGNVVAESPGLSENETAVVKAEDEGKTVTSTTPGRNRKRKVAMVDETPAETSQLGPRTRRTSKRIKAAGK
ncbi:DNA glycosylase [Staphylotrichum tortipilum]|uniref:DNA-(apurinic or apyrimidinic site) lyase n=1 Tax=Staphylotrichum tortipilum TaxID=2831512 RepID=A0AAN6MNT6_9PEZI|nr:DNA glycosylase [Staphylotrichum longicolle]